MRNNLVLYPTIEKKQLEKLNCRLENLNVLYTDGNEVYNLRCESDGDNAVNVIDDLGKWNLDRHNFELSGELVLDHSDILFGDEGVVDKTAVLGVGMIFKSRSSNLRGAHLIGRINAKTGDTRLKFNKAFGAGMLRGSLEVSFEVVLQGTQDPKCITPLGANIGVLSAMNFVLEGLGSTFSVFEKSIPGDPLWTVSCDWDEPEYSLFSDSVKVTINTAHPAWVIASDDEMRRELLKEIMASSMQIVISELEPEQYGDSEDYEPGSVCDAIFYLVSRAKLSVENGASLAQSIRAYLDKSMK